MRITSIGGGPGGLYAAILLARAGHEVTVYERNAAADTFGFGVVFSAATLGELEDSDAPSYEAIMRACARWDPVDVHYRGSVVRLRGNRFAAIARKTLLQVLQERAADVGVRLHFSTDVDPGDHLDVDLVLGADGINSVTRALYADAFGPRLETEGGKFIWLGTTKPLESFTFSFRATEHGWFQAHAYPYAEGMSTWIVECNEATWRRAGLDVAAAADLPPGVSDEHAVRFCTELFAPDLDGHPLVANNSKWLDWRTVRARRWHHRNVVLLGDACHTAHFSIGSGTKLAMEDAIALADALAREPDVESALVAYEADRKPAVDRWQEIAGESMDWFVRYPRYTGFPPPQFAYSLLSRSGRVSYENAKARDPRLISAFERWFTSHGGGGRDGSPPTVAPPPALTPLELGATRVPNRLVLTPAPDFSAEDGVPSAPRQADLERLARGGGGLALVDLVAPTPEARITPGCAGLWDDGHLGWLGPVCAAAHETGTLLGVQLVHAGARGATQSRDRGADRPLPQHEAWPLVAASPLPYSPRAQVPVELDRDGMDEVVAAFAAAAERAAVAGVDLLEVHAAHGYLLGGFSSPLTNQRADAYGGDLAGRLRFPLEVVAAVRAAWPEDRLLSVCLSASDLQPGGADTAEAVDAARRFADAGVDVFTVVAGHTTRRFRPDYRGAYGAALADVVRNEAGVPTIAVGGITTPWDANGVLAAGKADCCVLSAGEQPEPRWLWESGTPPAALALAGTREATHDIAQEA